MSRPYRISVRESLHRVIRADDHVRSQLEILPVLPAAEMSELLGRELQERGFEVEQGQAVRREDGVEIRVDLQTGEVVVQAELEQEVSLSKEQGGQYDRDFVRKGAAEKALRDRVQKELEKEAEDKEQELQNQATDKLEGELAEVRQELDQAVHRTLAEALKKKASRIGQIKEVTEDVENGSMTLVVEV